MPVPISVTHPKGKGLTAAAPSQLPTDGPFARLAQRQQEGEARQEACNADLASISGSNGAKDAHDAAASSSGAGTSESVVVADLNFAYPGLGERGTGWLQQLQWQSPCGLTGRVEYF
jgi:hypothetical protein